MRDKSRERWRWQIFSVIWLAYAGFYLTRKSFSVAKNELKKADVMGLTKGDMSWIDGANSVAYALGQFPMRCVLVPVQPPTDCLHHACCN